MKAISALTMDSSFHDALTNLRVLDRRLYKLQSKSSVHTDEIRQIIAEISSLESGLGHSQLLERNIVLIGDYLKQLKKALKQEKSNLQRTELDQKIGRAKAELKTLRAALIKNPTKPEQPAALPSGNSLALSELLKIASR